MSKTIAHISLLAVCLSAAPRALAATQDRPVQDRPAQDRPAQDRPAQERPAQESREQQQAREQAAREQQQAREQAARQQQQQRTENARQQQQRQQQERIRNARGNAQDDPAGQSSEVLFAKFKEEAAKHRDRSARIAALRRVANARQNQERVAELDQLLARENERHGEWVRRTRGALGAEEFESHQARIDGRAFRRGDRADTTRRTRETTPAGETPQRP